jgi:tetratricopeptide (TPR) repeat protein
MSISVALRRALELRQSLRVHPCPVPDFRDPESSIDVLYAACQSLLGEVHISPNVVLDDARVLHDTLSACMWPDDDLEERVNLLCSLSFLCWRAARLLGHSRESQHWESRYRERFRRSVQKEAIEADLRANPRVGPFPFSEGVQIDPEHVFQVLLCLQDQTDGAPQAVAATAASLYRELQAGLHPSQRDVELFFLGSFARLAASALKHSADQRAAHEWLDLAELHFRTAADPEPELARVMFVRLATLYTIDRFDLVLRVVPVLDATFAKFGMEEDRVKGKILWASTLKAVGRLEEACGILQPLMKARSQISPALYGYVLRECGDLHLIAGDYDRGLAELKEAAKILEAENKLTGLPAVIGMIGFGYRAQGMLQEAIEFFMDSQNGYARLGMKPYEAYTGLLVAETLLAMGRSREAEVVVLSVLPSIETQGMIVNGIAAINLLREAIRRQRLNPQILRAIRDRLGVDRDDLVG